MNTVLCCAIQVNDHRPPRTTRCPTNPVPSKPTRRKNLASPSCGWLKRGERGYKFALEGAGRSPQDGVATPSPSSVSTAAEQPKPVTAASCLCELMDSAPGSRNAFRHLASVEQTLKSKNTVAADGLFLFDSSAAHLKQAHRKLDGLWMEPAPVALAELRSKLANALAAQERREKEEAAPSRGSFSQMSSFLVDEKMQVSVRNPGWLNSQFSLP